MYYITSIYYILMPLRSPDLFFLIPRHHDYLVSPIFQCAM